MKTKARQNSLVPHILSGLVVCSSCGKNMTIKTVKANSKYYKYYYCPTGKKNGCTTPSMIRLEKLEQEVFKQMKEHIQDMKKYRDKLKNMSLEEIKREFTKEYYVKHDELYSQCDKVKLYQRSLKKSLFDGVINAEEYKDLSKMYDAELIGLDGDISVLKGMIDDIEENVENRLEWIDMICNFNNLTRFSRYELVILVNKITIAHTIVALIYI